jgi:hypothetical protein
MGVGGGRGGGILSLGKAGSSSQGRKKVLRPLEEVTSAPEAEAASLLALLVSARHAAGPVDLPGFSAKRIQCRVIEI